MQHTVKVLVDERPVPKIVLATNADRWAQQEAQKNELRDRRKPELALREFLKVT